MSANTFHFQESWKPPTEADLSFPPTTNERIERLNAYGQLYSQPTAAYLMAYLVINTMEIG